MISQGTNDKSKRRSKEASQRTAPSKSSAQRPAQAQRSGSAQRPVQGGQRRPQQNGAARRKKKKRVSPLLITLIVALVLAIAVFAGVGIYAMRYSNYDKIMPNVYVAGIDVGGMTKEEAKTAIESALNETTQQSLNVILPDQVLTFAPQQDTVVIDVDSAVDEAYAYGRNSTSPFAISRAIKAAQRRRNDIDISTSLTVDTDYIHDLIDSTAASVSTALTESVVETDLVYHTITVTIGTPGKSLDTDELYDLVYNAFINGDYSDIEFDYDVTYPATVQLDKLYTDMTTEPVNATYNKDTGEIDPETSGYTPATTLDKANEALAMAAPGDVLTFTFDETPAEITSEQLSDLLFRDVLYSEGTTYASNSNRTTNLRLACEAIDGTVLEPGEIFSFNKVVGERTADKGYKEATVFVSGNSENELGGGVCQVASTMYLCAMYADLEIVERSEHQFIVDYVPPGLDATIYYGSLDFQFRNSTDYPLKIRAYLDSGRCYIELIGTNITGQWVDIDYELVSTTPFSTIETNDPDKVQSGYTGYTYVITRYVYDADDNLIRTDTTEDLDKLGIYGLGTSTYSKRDKYVYSGGGSSNTPEPSTEPSPSPSTDPTPSPSTEPTPPPSTEPTPDPTPDPSTPEPEPPAENTGGGDTGGGDTGGGGTPTE